VYFDRRANYFSTEAICFFGTMDALKFLLQKAAKRAKSFKSRFCKETFVIFASFCSNFFGRLLQKATKETKIGLGLNPFAPFVFFC